MSLPPRKLSLFNTEIAANIAASDLLVALIGAPKANKNITFTGVIQAGFRLLATAVVNTVHLADEAVTTAKIGDKAVTNVKLRDSAAVSVIGRSVNSTGSPGDIVASSNNTVLQRTSNTLSFGKVPRSSLADSSAVSVVGRSANTSGAPADIQAAANNRVLKRKSNTLQFAQVESADIADSFKGNIALMMRGYVNANGTANQLPAGWSSTRVGAGFYEVTSGTAIFGPASSIVAMSHNLFQGATTINFNSSTKMTVRIRTLDNTPTDSDFSFILVRS